MNAEIICVGTELLLGDILNTNSQFLSRRLAECGLNVYLQSVVGDNKERLKNQLITSLKRSDVIILSGGLGPTEDDITKEIVAEVTGLSLELHTKSLNSIESFFARVGRVMSENNRKQALTISGAKVLDNKFGTAPGYILEWEERKIILLPGPPSELVPMFEEYVFPYLNSLSSETIYSENIRIFGIGESLVATQCGDLLKSKNPTVATYASAGEVWVTAKAENARAAEALLKPFTEKLIAQFGTNIYTIKNENLQQTVVELLKSKGKKVATAESCTAGMLSSRITEVAGSSDVFEMGMSAYANRVKVDALGVSEKDIKQFGAVSKEVAAEMSVGIRQVSGADIGVGITGVAGPGESEGKPAGLVYIAISDGINVYVRKIMCRGADREHTRTVATSTALDMVRRYLEKAEDLLSYGTFLGDPLNLIEGYNLPNNKPISLGGNVPEKFKELQKKLDFGDSEMLRLVELMERDELSPFTEAKKEAPATEFSFETEEKAEEVVDVEPEQTSLFETEEPKALETASEELTPVVTEEAVAIKPEESQNDFKSLTEDDFPILKEEVYKPNKKVKKAMKSHGGETFKKQKEKKEKVSKKSFKDILASIFPVKSDSKGETLKKVSFLAASLVFVLSIVLVLLFAHGGDKEAEKYNHLRDIWHITNSVNGEAKDSTTGFYNAFTELRKENADITGWIKIEDTKIDYPVLKTDNNDFYLNHGIDKKSNKNGAISLDANSQIGSTRNGRNVAVYGKNVADGSMFGELKKYLDFEFYKAHPTLEFATLYNKGYYKVFAVFVTNSLPEHDNGEVFDYTKSAFISETEFNSWVNALRLKSTITTNVDLNFDDEILTISTDAADFDGAKLVVMARKVRNDADYYSPITASINPAPLYPEIWYEKNGGSKPTLSVDSETSSEALSDGNESSLDGTLENGLEGDETLTSSEDSNSSSSDENGAESEGNTSTESSSENTNSIPLEEGGESESSSYISDSGSAGTMVDLPGSTNTEEDTFLQMN